MASLNVSFPSPALRDGEYLGAYRILRRIGAGGMAEVYKARREDGIHGRSVAIKIIRHRWVGEPALEQRFRTEREILAALDHPAIARMIDGGVTAQGTPYVVMDFVDGCTLEEYCQRADVTVATKLRLFLELCSAVQYAHRNLIVHRDLKPNNVLVTVDDRIKLLDFGIAKLLRPEVWSMGPAVTQPADRLATPEFAAPEQLRGGTITTASDVYSLGVLLFHLLTTKLPYDVAQVDWERAIRIVGEAEPPPASDTGLPADLDAIIRMAMRKDSAARYASVDRMAEDIERHLRREPVMARQGDWAYAVQSFVRRHAVGVGLTTALVFALATTVGALVALNSRVTQERDTAEATSDFLADLLSAADPLSGPQRTVRQIVDEAAARLPKLKDQPRVQARLSEKLGEVYHQLGEYKLSRPFAEQAIRLFEQTDGARSLDAARCMVRLADLLRTQGEYAPAVALAESSLRIRRAGLPARHADIADSLNIIGIVRQVQGRGQDAEDAYREAVEIRRVAQPGTSLLALSLGNYANTLYNRRDLEKAERLYREALAIRRKALGESHPRVASSLGQISGVLLDKGDKKGALAATAEAETIIRKALPAGHPDLARTLRDHGVALRANGMFPESEKILRECWTIDRRSRGAESPDASLSMSGLAKTLAAAGRRDEAASLLRDAIRIRRKALGDKHPLVAKGEKELAALTPVVASTPREP